MDTLSVWMCQFNVITQNISKVYENHPSLAKSKLLIMGSSLFVDPEREKDPLLMDPSAGEWEKKNLWVCKYLTYDLSSRAFNHGFEPLCLF